jgi:hypothetical protein
MTQNSPVIQRKVLCPLCDSESAQFYISQKSYIISKYDEDQHPIEYQFYDKKCSHYHPNYYEIFYCRKCYYADIADNFLQGKEAVLLNQKATMQRIGEMIESEKAKNNGTYHLLGDSLKINNEISFNESLNLHLLAIYIHELPELELRNYHKLAELYLRAGWLFKENREVSYSFLEDDTYDRFSNIFIDYFSEYKKFTSKFDHFKVNIRKALEEENVESALKENYIDELYKLEILYNNANAINAELMNMQEFGIGQFKLENVNVSQGEPFKSYSSMSEFIEMLNMHWPDLPNGEKICFEKACEYYDLELNKGSYYKKFLDKLKVYKRIIVLRKKLEQYSVALEALVEFTKKCNEYKALLNTRIERLKKYNSEAEIEELISQLHSLTIEQEKIQRFGQNILELKKKKELTIANEIMKKYKNEPLDVIKTKFLEAGLPREKTLRFIQHIENTRNDAISENK